MLAVVACLKTLASRLPTVNGSEAIMPSLGASAAAVSAGVFYRRRLLHRFVRQAMRMGRVRRSVSACARLRSLVLCVSV